MKKPIGPTAHGVLDYGFATMIALAPSLFNLRCSARTLCYGFAANTAITNGLTDHGVGLKPLIPLRVHGQLEVPIVPALLLLPWATGAFKQRNARRFFVWYFLAALANFLLTDYNACEPQGSESEEV